MDNNNNDSKFPISGIIPKDETQVSLFLSKYPEYDGRDVIVAIFDTGVDPGAPGLQKTSDGKVKILDVFDTSGSGDVDMSNQKTIEVDDSGNCYIVGLSGRTLNLGKNWSNQIRTVQVGLKNAFDLFPDDLRNRISQEHKRAWEKSHHILVNQLKERLECDTLSPREIKDIKEQLTQLNENLLTYQEEDYFIDCIMYSTSGEDDLESYYVLIDTNQSGEMHEYKPMRDYYFDKEYSVFNSRTMLNYSVKVLDKTKLTIVTDAGSHGTHVAGIVAANFPNNPEYNGVAPGAQIVSIKIGDSRLGSMETHNSLIRGLAAALERNAHIINISYGEGSTDPTKGRFLELCESMINEHGVIIVSSAGNEGPCLSTVGSPGGVGKSIIGVGATATSSLMETSYSMCDILPSSQFTWSSCGPTYDGDMGVSITSIGGAISSVPNWTLSRNRLMNGTSMSSPHASGNIALMLSALKAQKKPYTPHRVRRALENTAKRLDGIEIPAQGCGVVQIDAAYDYMMEYYDCFEENFIYDVKVSNPHNGMDMHSPARGIYLRDIHQTQHPITCMVSITPTVPTTVLRSLAEIHGNKYSEDEKDKYQEMANLKKIELSLQLKLVCDVDWVKIPFNLVLMNSGREFSVTILGNNLKEGGLYVTEILAFDSSVPRKGPLFRVPITVVKPNIPALDHSLLFIPNQASLQSSVLPSPNIPLHVYHRTFDHRTISKVALFKPGQIDRNFLHIPSGATWLELTMQVKSELVAYQSRNFMIESRQILPQMAGRDCSFGKFIKVSDLSKKIFCIPLYADNHTIEVTIAQFWSSLGETSMEIVFTFHGIQPIPYAFPNSLSFASLTQASKSPLFATSTMVELTAASPIKQIQLFCPLSPESVTPTATLDTVLRNIFPSTSSVKPLLGKLNQLRALDHFTYQLTIEYKFQVNDPNLEVKPTLPLISHFLYESDFQAQFYMILDSNNRRFGVGDSWPKYVKLGLPGTYTVIYQICHHKEKTLTDLQTIPMELYIRLPTPISLSVHSNFQPDAPTVSSFELPSGRRCAIYLNAKGIPAKIPSSIVENSDFLVGYVAFIPSSPQFSNPLQYPISYLHLTAPSASSTKNTLQTVEAITKEMLFSIFEAKPLPLVEKWNNKVSFEEFESLFSEMENSKELLSMSDKLVLYKSLLSKLENSMNECQSKLNFNNNDDNNNNGNGWDECYFFSLYLGWIQKIEDALSPKDLAADLVICKSFGDEDDGNASQSTLVTDKVACYVSSLFVKCQLLLFCWANRIAIDQIVKTFNNNNNGEDRDGENYIAVHYGVTSALKELRKWAGDDSFNNTPKFVLLRAQFEFYSGNFGLALKHVHSCLKLKNLPNEFAKTLEQLRVRVFEELHWKTHLQHHRNLLLTHFPSSLPLFNH